MQKKTGVHTAPVYRISSYIECNFILNEYSQNKYSNIIAKATGCELHIADINTAFVQIGASSCKTFVFRTSPRSGNTTHTILLCLKS